MAESTSPLESFFLSASYPALVALVVYDYVLTMKQEIEYIWLAGNKVSVGGALFMIVRYSTLAYPFVALFTFLDKMEKSRMSCVALQWCTIISTALISSAVGALSAFRVYALYGGKRSLMAIILVTSQSVPAIQLYIGSLNSVRVAVSSMEYICEVTSTLNINTFERMLIAMRVACILVDTIVIVLTCAKLLRQLPIFATGERVLPLGKVLITDGLVYFIAMLTSHIFGLALSQNSETLVTLISWNTVVTGILASRCILDLREAAAKATSSQPSSISLHTVRDEVHSAHRSGEILSLT